MKEIKTAYGTVKIGSLEDIFRRMVDILETAAATYGDPFSVGLTGGSTPKAFYKWVAEVNPFSNAVLKQAAWSTSDERMVPLSDPESNFGNADRLMLTSLGIPEYRKFPWPVAVDAHSAALVYERRIHERFGSDRSLDLCFLGMGDDGHTASIFPGSPLLFIESGTYFAPVQVPDKGWRLSITPTGLQASSKIIITVTGAAKAERLKEVLEGPSGVYPIQLMSNYPDRVEWLLDEEAASLLAQ